MNTFDKLEHHAYLTVDELPGLSELFAKGVQKMIVDLRGRTTIVKNKPQRDNLGIKKLSHTYLDVKNNDYEINNESELNALAKSYEKAGVDNLYLVRLVVQWNNGDMQEWHRHVFHVKDKEVKRTFPNGRNNVLAMKLGEYQAVNALKEIYGDSMVNGTMCEIVNIEGQTKRVCLGTLAKE